MFPFLTYSLNVQSFPYGSISLIDQYFSCAGSVFALWIHSFNDHSFLFRFTSTMISVSLIESLLTFSSKMSFLFTHAPPSLAVEHLLSIISAVCHDICPKRSDPIESYLYAVGLQLFYVFPYSNWLGWLGIIQNALLTFIWSYTDIFLMIIGIGLSELFARLTRQLRRLVQQVRECGSQQTRPTWHIPHSTIHIPHTTCQINCRRCSQCPRCFGHTHAHAIAPLWSLSCRWTLPSLV